MWDLKLKLETRTTVSGHQSEGGEGRGAKGAKRMGPADDSTLCGGRAGPVSQSGPLEACEISLTNVTPVRLLKTPLVQCPLDCAFGVTSKESLPNPRSPDVLSSLLGVL